MPQLTPFFFVNQLFVTFFVLFVLILLLSIYFLPNFKLIQTIRMYITKLTTPCNG